MDGRHRTIAMAIPAQRHQPGILIAAATASATAAVTAGATSSASAVSSATASAALSAMAAALLLSLGATGLPQPARAQRVVPKLQTLCPLGYVDTFNGRCSTLGLMTYTVAPTEGRPCPSGWMNVGGGYCRRK